MFHYSALLILLLLIALCFLLWRWGKTFHSPHLKYSTLVQLISPEKNLKERYSYLPKMGLGGTFLLFACAFLDPHFFIEKKREEKKEAPIKQVTMPTEGIAIYLVLDQSGSMAGEVKGGRKTPFTKMDLLKQVTKDFVQGNPQIGLKGRPEDMLGLVAFARGAQVLAPLTLDHLTILDQLNQLTYTTDLNQDGTSIGYAIFKTASLIAATRHYAQDLIGEGKPAYEIKSSVMILVTDGLQAPNPLDKGKRLRNIELLEAGEYARQLGVRLYIVNVEPRMASEEFAAHRSLMKKTAELTGGRFYLVDSSIGLDRIYADIDRLEKSILPVETRFVTPPKGLLPHLFRRLSLYPYFIAAGMALLLGSLILESTFMRRVP